MREGVDSVADFDPQVLRQKYLRERDKRLRPEADQQFVEAVGDYEDFVADPYVAPGFSRAALTEDVDVLVVGGGLGGLITAVELRRRGMKSLRMIDQAGDFGGTWYWNRYPGVRCDIESYIYLPYIEEMGVVPRERYAEGAEIFAHCQAIGRHFGLYDHALFQTKVEKLAWDEASGRWLITTDRGDLIRARYVSVSQGPLAKVKLPGIPGIRSFKGRMFHSARWDYAYTGGDASGGLTGLADKRVAVIGTGATAVQIVPRLADHAQQVLVFQRTPSAIDVRSNSLTDSAWLKAQPKGWQRQRMDNFVAVVSGLPVAENLVGDRWTDFWMRFGQLMAEARSSGDPFNPGEIMQQADFEKMEMLRARVDELVTDPSRAEQLKPWYNLLCKRPLFSDEFLQTFNRPNVTLIDTDGLGVERITETVLVAGGIEHAVDCIVLATGFDVGAPPHKVGAYEVIGRGGLTMAEKWGDDLRTVHGTQMHGFPNFHIVGGTAQGTTAFNFTHTLLVQGEHAAELIAHCLTSNVKAMEVTAAAEERWHAQLEAKHVDHQQFYEDCTPGFLNNEGNFKDRPTFVGGTYGGGPFEYVRIITQWREDGLTGDVSIDMLDAASPSIITQHA